MVKGADNILVSSWDYLKHAHIYGLWQKNQDKLNAMMEQFQAEAIDISAKAQKIANEQQK